MDNVKKQSNTFTKKIDSFNFEPEIPQSCLPKLPSPLYVQRNHSQFSYILTNANGEYLFIESQRRILRGFLHFWFLPFLYAKLQKMPLGLCRARVRSTLYIVARFVGVTTTLLEEEWAETSSDGAHCAIMICFFRARIWQ